MPPSSTIYPKFDFIIRIIMGMSISQRSLMINVAQSQSVPESGTLYERIISSPPFFIHGLSERYRLQSLLDNTFFCQALTSPVGSSIIIDLLRSTPYSKSDVTDIMTLSVTKEIATLSRYPKGYSSFNWRVFFDPDLFGSQLHPSIPSNPLMAQFIHFRLRKFFKSVEGRLLFPRASHKNMSRDTRNYVDMDLSNVPIFGQDDWCRYYHESGVMAEGMCEMRQKWYPSQAKPRVYYAMGGSAYRRSRYIQTLALQLCDILEPTNRFSKLFPDRLSASPDDSFLIYDLSSFTSNLEEMRYFFEQLAIFVQGIHCTVWDEIDGPIECDLGDLFSDYSEFCVFFPEVSLERFNFGTTYHHKASMLGIYGNLAFATVTHYLAMALLYDSTSYINVAGDDAIANLSKASMDPRIIIEEIGDVEWSKTYNTELDSSVVCLKRPLIRGYDYLHLGDTVISPNLALLRALFCDDNDPRYSFYHDYLSDNQKISIAGSELVRFLRHVTKRISNLSDQDYVWAKDVYFGVRRMVFGGYPKTGWKPCGDPITFPVFPDSLDDFCTIDNFILYNFAIHYKDIVTLPVCEYIPVDISQDWVSGTEFRANASQLLGCLSRLGYISMEKVVQQFYHQDGYDQYERMLNHNYADCPPVYTITVLCDVPDHLIPK